MKKVILTFAAVLLFLGVTFADNNEASHHVGISIPTVAIVDVEDASGPAQPIILSPSIDNLEAGKAVDFSSGTGTNTSLYLQYTSIVSKEKNRTITVKIDGNSKLPAWVSLKLAAGG
ncbi:MAG: hypothetical protein J7L95_08350, partial [Prolixibacteraceae bacterium]|nr:hypothetical protein [Prolixibacteraceae bacterium]